MAFHAPGGGEPSAFHQAQVAHPPYFSPSFYAAAHIYAPHPQASPHIRQERQQLQQFPQHHYNEQRRRRGGDGGGGGGLVSEVNASPLPSHQPFVDGQFDIFEWHTQFQSCVCYFLDHSQHTEPVQAVAAFINIQLPFQKAANPVHSSKPPTAAPSHGGGGGSSGTVGPGSGIAGPSSSSRAIGSKTGRSGGSSLLPSPPPTTAPGQALAYCTLTPYIRRLVATGFDFPAVLHGFFGDDWALGVGPLHEAERRNYLFAAKSDNWLRVKASYDMGEEQMIPFLKPLQNVSEAEIEGAEMSWSEWLAMQDWMLGPRAPAGVGGGGGHGHGHIGGGRVGIKREEE